MGGLNCASRDASPPAHGQRRVALATLCCTWLLLPGLAVKIVRLAQGARGLLGEEGMRRGVKEGGER
eukprot:8936100-Pyramimonas_sp.AAC.1